VVSSHSGTPLGVGQAMGTLDHETHHGPDSGEATTFPHIVFSAPRFGDNIQMALFPGTPKLESRNCPETIPNGVPGLTFPHIIFSVPRFGDNIQMALFPGTPKLESRNCPETIPDGVPGLWELITPDCKV